MHTRYLLLEGDGTMELLKAEYYMYIPSLFFKKAGYKKYHLWIVQYPVGVYASRQLQHSYHKQTTIWKDYMEHYKQKYS